MRRFYCLALLVTFFTAHVLAQNAVTHFSARTPGWWTFGIDGGLAYQSSDVRTQFKGWGAGLTLGKNLYYRPGAAVSFDLRGRLLYTRTYGADSKRSFGLAKNNVLNGTYKPALNYLIDKTTPNDSSFVYQNFQHSMGELGLEGVLTFNRLRERTGVVLSLFGGIGLDLYATKTDQLDDAGNKYNYLSVNDNGSRASILADLDALRDGRYESRADGFEDQAIKLGFMPGAGIELGYQVAPRFVIGIGHKITFSRTDLLDGQRWDNANAATGNNDWQHYTNLFFRWDLQPYQRKMSPPVIEITDPTANPYVTNVSTHYVRARIRNVKNPTDVRCFVNGNNAPFDFRQEDFGINVRLRTGRNEVRILASNAAGRDEETAVIIFEDRVIPPPPPPPPPPPAMRKPEVRITQPARSPFTTDRDNAGIIANIRNVNDRRDIRLTVNGTETRFNFAENLEANVPLREGRNIIRVEATNQEGRASDEVEIIRQRDEPAPPPPPAGKKPEVRITQPRNRTESTAEKTYTLKGTVDNVDSRSDITVSLNGSSVNNFTFDTRSHLVTAELTLQSANNDVTIRARNRYGEGEASAVITKTGGIKNPPRRPEVSISNPTEGASFTQPDVSLNAVTRNVTAKSEVTVFLNGQPLRDFDFNTTTQSLTTRIGLRAGENTLTVRAANANGNDEATVKVRYTQPAQPPKVRITEPAAANTTTKNATATIRATTQNVAAKSEITFELNHRPANFNFDANNGNITAEVSLQEGDNPVNIKVTNRTGSDQTSVTIRYDAAKAPKVTISTPVNNAEISETTTQLNATVLNVTGKNDLTVSINGRPAQFEYDARRQQVTALVPVGEGSNTIRVAARTAVGADEASVTVRRTAKKPPTVKISAPADKSTTDQAVATLTATTQYVNRAENVQVLLNGGALRDVTFNRGGSITAKLPLITGNNTVRVIVTNNDGKDEATATVTYRPLSVAKPVVTFTNPKSSGTTVDSRIFAVKATVTGVTRKEDILFTANGRSPRDYTFDARSGVLTCNFSLKDGKNAFAITATNGGGSTTAATDVTFTQKASGAPVPIVKIESASQPTVSPFNPNEGRSSVVASVKNITGKDQISIKAGNEAVTDFTYLPNTGQVTFVIKLKKGMTLIEVKATNADGVSASDSTSVKFE